jgi:hypothetical protein
LKSILDLLVVIFVFGLRKHLIASCYVRHKVERELDVELYGMDDDRELMARRNARHEALRMAKLTVRCREFTRRFTRHRSIVLMSSLY